MSALPIPSRTDRITRQPVNKTRQSCHDVENANLQRRKYAIEGRARAAGQGKEHPLRADAPGVGAPDA